MGVFFRAQRSGLSPSYILRRPSMNTQLLTGTLRPSPQIPFGGPCANRAASHEWAASILLHSIFGDFTAFCGALHYSRS